MVERMIPTYLWDDEYWILYSLDDLNESIQRLEHCDGSVSNTIFSVKIYENYQVTLEELFGSYTWIDKILLLSLEGNLIGVFKSSS